MTPKITMTKVDNLKPYENNPRNNQGAVNYVAESIREFGFKVPIVVDKNNVIIAGHTRYLAAQELGLKEVPVIVAKDLTEDQVKAFRIADNKVAEQSSWNMIRLSKEVLDIDFDLSGFGFSDAELEGLASLGADFTSSYAEPAQVYQPNLRPVEAVTHVTQEQVQDSDREQATKFSSQYVEDKTQVVCPYCGKDFEID